MPDKIMRTSIELVDGAPCVVFSGQGKNLCFPAQGIQKVFEDAMRRFSAWQAQHGIKAGQWSSAMIVEPQTWSTGTTDAGKVAVIIDHGLPTEQTLALSADYARQLAPQLLEKADMAGVGTKPN